MAQQLSGSPTSPFTTMRSTSPPLHNAIAHRMSQASGYATTEAPIGRPSEYWPLDFYMDHSLGATSHGQNQIPGPSTTAAETWDSTSTPAHRSLTFMTADIQEQAHLLDGIAAIEARQGIPSPANAARPSNPTANATVAGPRRDIMWAFSRRNFRKLLRKYFACKEKVISSRYTTKAYMEEDIRWAVRVRDLEAHIRVLEAHIQDQETTMGSLNDECQEYWNEITDLQNLRQLDLQHKDHQISSLLDRLTGTHSFAERNSSMAPRPDFN
ncbi:hypothetical protein VE03_06270 [Pseudogymnoascus sp. 23342-1-I1]|nr:hypothetical protein VE03_06270 [Pseudogymnoascus sp. 23342-1-I1]